MNKTRLQYFWLLAGLMLATATFAQQEDFQLRLGAAAGGNISDKFKWSFEVQQRFEQNSSAFDQFQIEPGISWRPFSILKIAAGYRFINFTDRNNNLGVKQRMHIDLRLSENFGEFRLKYRTRLQYGFADYANFQYLNENNFIQRHLFGLDYKIFGTRFTPGIAYELYHQLNRLDKPGITKHRIITNCNIKLSGHSDIEAYYIISKEVNMANPWTKYILGATYKYSF